MEGKISFVGGALTGILFTTTMLSVAGLFLGFDFVAGFGLGLFGCAKLSISREREGLGVWAGWWLILGRFVEGHLDGYGLKDLTDKVNVEYSRDVSPKYVSNILYRLGMVRRKKLHGLTLVYASKGLLEESCKRIGVTISYNIPREHLPHPSQPNPEEWKTHSVSIDF